LKERSADAVGMIEQFTAGMDFQAFRSNPMAVAAVERKLQVISEAAIRLGDEAELSLAGISAASETIFAKLCSDSTDAVHHLISREWISSPSISPPRAAFTPSAS
jgi:hypothetical protein